jgi:hypothetical protein
MRLACLLYTQFIDTSCELGPSKHLDGAANLLERLGPEHFTAGIQHRAFLFLRFHVVSAARSAISPF